MWWNLILSKKSKAHSTKPYDSTTVYRMITDSRTRNQANFKSPRLPLKETDKKHNFHGLAVDRTSLHRPRGSLRAPKGANPTREWEDEFEWRNNHEKERMNPSFGARSITRGRSGTLWKSLGLKCPCLLVKYPGSSRIFVLIFFVNSMSTTAIKK